MRPILTGNLQGRHNRLISRLQHHVGYTEAGDHTEDREMPSNLNENPARGMLHAIPIAAGLWLLIAIAAYAVAG
jgi:hypothetical protein